MFKHVVKEEIIIKAELRNIPKLRNFITEVGRKYKFEEKFLNAYKLVVEEIVTNIIRHGYRDIKNGEILMKIIVRRLSMTILILDRGKSYDPRMTKDPDLKKYIAIGKKGGLGTFIVRKLVDDIQYTVTGRGNELRLTKFREEPEKNLLANYWYDLSLKMKAAIISGIIMVALGAFLFTYFNSFLLENELNRVNETLQSLGETISQNLITEIDEERYLEMYENIKALQESNSSIIQAVLILDAQKNFVARYPVLEPDYTPIVSDVSAEIGEREKIRYSVSDDSSLYVFVKTVTDQDMGGRLVGYEVFITSEKTIVDNIRAERIKIFLRISLGILLLYIASILLIRILVTPFQRLAEWVRNIGKGVVDDDEIDIDARDELGEIAQAFNEMTAKFRDSQQALIERQRMHRELQVAQEIQQMLLPRHFPEVYGFEITSYYQAAKEVGGDLFDFVNVDDHSIGICVADVSGKGVPGSMVMTMIRTTLRLEAKGNKDPADVLSRVNRFVTGDIRKGMFVTAFYMILDSKRRIISYASAGHNPMILYRGKSKETYYLNPPGFPLGITLPDPNQFARTIKSEKIRLHPDDLLVVYTDGITEAMNPQRELFSEERLLEAVRKEGHHDVETFVKKLQSHLSMFTSGFEQNDDITLVAVKESMEEVDIKVKALKDVFEKIARKEATLKEACAGAGISVPTYYRYKKMYEFGARQALIQTLEWTVKSKNNLTDKEEIRRIAEDRLRELLGYFERVNSGEFKVAEACRLAGISAPTYYRYQKIFNEGGYRYLRDMLHGYTNVAMQHLSIEVKTKMYDIIQKNPAFGPSKISKMLATEEYGNLEISPALIYAELKRAKLSTRERREKFIKRGGKKRLKPPGTPLLTLDGKVMVGFRLDDIKDDNTLFTSPTISAGQAKEKILSTVSEKSS